MQKSPGDQLKVEFLVLRSNETILRIVFDLDKGIYKNGEK